MKGKGKEGERQKEGMIQQEIKGIGKDRERERRKV